VLPRHDFFTKEIRRLLQGGKVAVREHSQSPVLPWAQRAYDARLSAGSTALLAHFHQTGVPTPELHRAGFQEKCIAQNALGAVKLASLTGFAPVISCMRGRHVIWTTPQGQNGAGGRNRAFDLMRVAHSLGLAALFAREWILPMRRPPIASDRYACFQVLA